MKYSPGINRYLKLALSEMQLSKYVIATILGFTLCSPLIARSQVMTPTPLVMQVVAHEDDDILFMNPDLSASVSAGTGVVTVYVTAGESNGSLTGDPRALYAAQREEGARAAYAAMLKQSNTPLTWIRSLLTLPNGIVAEKNTLRSNPAVVLIFLNLPDGGDPDTAYALYHLYEGVAPSSYATIVPTGTDGIGLKSSTYGSKSDLVNALVFLMNQYKPTVIRSLDPRPYSCPACTGIDYVNYDNTDHTYVGRFVDVALNQYLAASTSVPRVSLRNYLGYSIGQFQGNLGASDYTVKRSVFDAYKYWDHNLLSQENNYLGYFGATYPKYSGGTGWLTQTQAGNLAAFSVQNGKLAVWSRPNATQQWTGPVLQTSSDPLMPGVAVAKRPVADNRMQVFALSIPLAQNTDGAPESLKIVTSIENTAGGLNFTKWLSLGIPTMNCDPNASCLASLGSPIVATSQNGLFHVFIRNDRQGISAIHQRTGDTWSSWSDIGGADLFGDPTVVVSKNGLIHVFGTSRNGQISHWIETANNAETFNIDSHFPTTSAASTTNASIDSDGKIALFYRQPGTANVVFMKESVSDSLWSATVTNITNDGGFGPVVPLLNPTTKKLSLVTTNSLAGLSSSTQSSPASSVYSGWSKLNGLYVGYPSAVADNGGNTVIGAIGQNGRLYINGVAVGN